MENPLLTASYMVLKMALTFLTGKRESDLRWSGSADVAVVWFCFLEDGITRGVKRIAKLGNAASVWMLLLAV